MAKRITEFPQASEITAGKYVALDGLITESATVQQITNFVLDQVPTPEEVAGTDFLVVQVFS